MGSKPTFTHQSSKSWNPKFPGIQGSPHKMDKMSLNLQIVVVNLQGQTNVWPLFKTKDVKIFTVEDFSI